MTILGNMISEKIGRRPSILTTGHVNRYTGHVNRYTGPPKLSDKFTDDSLSRLYAGGGYGYVNGTPHTGHPIGIWPWLYTWDIDRGDRDPMLRLFVSLRSWLRRARTAVYNRALVRHYTPSLLGKRRPAS